MKMDIRFQKRTVMRIEVQVIEGILMACSSFCFSSMVAGSMLDMIKRKKKQKIKAAFMDEVTIATVLKETLKGLEYLHEHGQIHRWVPFFARSTSPRPMAVRLRSMYHIMHISFCKMEPFMKDGIRVGVQR